jgi:AcrR family transcriptional regulator
MDWLIYQTVGKLTNMSSEPSRAHAAPKKPPAAEQTLPNTFPAAVAALPKPVNARERILHAAMSLLNEEGFAALTQTRVAERAGVRQSHVTYYFPTRNALLRETAVFGCDAMLCVMAASIRSGDLTRSNFLDFLISDVSDRRFARLMCGLIVASDEDAEIKPWLAGFEEANRDRIEACLRELGIEASRDDVELFHAAFVGALILDLGESSEQSLARSQRIMRAAYRHIEAHPAVAPDKAARKRRGTTAGPAMRRPGKP